MAAGIGVGAIADDAMDVLQRVGVRIHAADARALFLDHGAELDPATDRVRLPPELVSRVVPLLPCRGAPSIGTYSRTVGPV